MPPSERAAELRRGEVGDVGEDVGGLAVAAHDHAVLAVAELRGAQPQRRARPRRRGRLLAALVARLGMDRVMHSGHVPGWSVVRHRAIGAVGIHHGVRGGPGEILFNPAAGTTVEAGDILIAIGRAESLTKLNELARGAK